MTFLGGGHGGGMGDAAAHVSVGGYMIDAQVSLEDAELHVRELLGRPMTDEERAELAAAHAKAVRRAAEHGAEYHGFGNPPDDDDDAIDT